MPVGFQQDFHHVLQAQGDDSGDVERVRVHSLALHHEMRCKRMILRRLLVTANQRHDHPPDASVEPGGLDLDHEQSRLIASRVFIDRELRYLC